MKSNFNRPQQRRQFSEGQKSKGILDDHAVRGNVDTKGIRGANGASIVKGFWKYIGRSDDDIVHIAGKEDLTGTVHIGSKSANTYVSREYTGGNATLTIGPAALGTGQTFGFKAGDLLLSSTKDGSNNFIVTNTAGSNGNFVMMAVGGCYAMIDSDDNSTTQVFDVRKNGDWGDTGIIARFKEDGNVGIGVINPAEKLDVDGNVNITGDVGMRVDDKKIILGAGAADLNIYSDGTNGIIDVGTGLRLGNGTTDYTEIKFDGEIILHGTARVKKDMWIGANAIRAIGSKPATFVAHGIKGAWQFADAVIANQETVSGTVKLPDNMDRTVVPTFKVGWSADGISPGNCEWQLEYLWLQLSDDTTAAAQETLTATGTASGGSNGLVITSFSGIDLPSSTDQAMFWRLTRLSAHANDTIADTVEMHGNLFSYTANKIGTAA